MVGLGTILNTLAILLGSLFGRFLSDSTQNTLTTCCGVSALFIAVTGALEEMLTVENGAIVSGGSMLVVICLAIGAVIGEALKRADLLCGHQSGVGQEGEGCQSAACHSGGCDWSISADVNLKVGGEGFPSTFLLQIIRNLLE